jgi:PAS domain S-box-containing protein
MSAAAELYGLDPSSRVVLGALPVAVYTTDAEGRITFYNQGAVRLWGREPRMNEERWCAATRLVGPDGQTIAPQDSPPSAALATGRAVRAEAVLERPDGSRADVVAHCTPLFDARAQINGCVVMLLDVTEKKRAERGQAQLSAIVESSDDAILSKSLDGIIQTWNKGAERIFGYGAEDVVGQSVLMLIPADRHHEEADIIARVRAGEPVEHFETVRQRKDGSLIDISLTVSPVRNADGVIIGASKIARDISGRRIGEQQSQKQSRRLAILNHIAKTLSQDLDQARIVQSVTDIATELSGARFGAFFYNVMNDQGQSYLLYALSGASRDVFDKFGMPRNTAVFHPTFTGEGVVRSDDIRKDPRYGKSAPHHGMPQGHLPVVSYLAAPVVSRSGEVIGGLFFGHEDPGVFGEDAEALVMGIASHAAVAMDNARLHEASQREVERRKKAEESKDLLLHEIKHRVKNTLGMVQAIASQTFRAAPREERDAFGARLRAMSEAHDLLTNQDWGNVAVLDVVRRAIAAFNPDRFTLHGDETELPAAKALLLAMTVHELGTNAVKYGALSNGDGRVAIDWHGGNNRLTFHWHETGGPTVAAPTHRGFGSNLIQRAMAGEQGSAHFDYAPGGLRCSLVIAAS